MQVFIPPTCCFIPTTAGVNQVKKKKRDDDQVFTARARTTSTNSSGHTRQRTVEETNRQGYSHRLNIPYNARKSRTRVVANLRVFSTHFCRRRSKLINNKARPLRLVATVVHWTFSPFAIISQRKTTTTCVCVGKILTRFHLKPSCVINQTLLNLGIARESQTDIGLITRPCSIQG